MGLLRVRRDLAAEHHACVLTGIWVIYESFSIISFFFLFILVIFLLLQVPCFIAVFQKL